MKTILAILIIGAVVLLIVAGLVAIAMWRAPEGYEDSTGFHYGDPK